MKYYLIKTISRSIDKNLNSVNAIQIRYYGKNQKLLGRYNIPENSRVDFAVRPWWLPEYGYTRECDARRSRIYKNPENTDVKVIFIEY